MNELIASLGHQQAFGEISLSRAIDLAMEAGLDYELAQQAVIDAGCRAVLEARQ